MRQPFAKLLREAMQSSPAGDSIVLLTADMGYGLWDTIRAEFPDRAFNVGSAEQLMIGMAAGMSLEGKIPVCYSITPFLLYRPFEFIRNYMNFDKLPIKLVGGGRDRDYGYLGNTHWAEDDLDIMRQLKNIRTLKPATEADLNGMFNEFLFSPYPYYLNLKK